MFMNGSRIFFIICYVEFECCEEIWVIGNLSFDDGDVRDDV